MQTKLNVMIGDKDILSESGPLEAIDIERMASFASTFAQTRKRIREQAVNQLRYLVARDCTVRVTAWPAGMLGASWGRVSIYEPLAGLEYLLDPGANHQAPARVMLREHFFAGQSAEVHVRSEGLLYRLICIIAEVDTDPSSSDVVDLCLHIRATKTTTGVGGAADDDSPAGHLH